MFDDEVKPGVWYAVVGTDGLRPVVWGIGETEADAVTDAAQWLEGNDFTTHEITEDQAAHVRTGDVSWPIVLPAAPANVKPARAGYTLVRCTGEAHNNPHIDNCGQCAPRWGWREVKL
jgi:hypothetical protein